MCFGQRSKSTTTTITTKQKIKHINPYQSRKSNPGPLAPQSDALPLDHRLLSGYLTVSAQ